MAETLRDVQKAQTRRRIIEHAASSFTQVGYVGTSVGTIADEVGMTRATFYLHFASKLEVAIVVWGERVATPALAIWGELAESLAGFIADPTATLDDWFPRVVEQWDEHGWDDRASWSVNSAEPELRAMNAQLRGQIADLIVASLEGVSQHSGDALRIRAVAAFDIHTRLLVDWSADVIPKNRRLVAEALADAWRALLT